MARYTQATTFGQSPTSRMPAMQAPMFRSSIAPAATSSLMSRQPVSPPRAMPQPAPVRQPVRQQTPLSQVASLFQPAPVSRQAQPMGLSTQANQQGQGETMLRQQMLEQQFQQQRGSQIGGLTQAQQAVYREAQGLGGGIDPLAVALGGPNALAQARASAQIPQVPQNVRQNNPVTLSASTPDSMREMEAARQRAMAYAAGPSIQAYSAPNATPMHTQQDMLMALMQYLSGGR